MYIRLFSRIIFLIFLLTISVSPSTEPPDYKPLRSGKIINGDFVKLLLFKDDKDPVAGERTIIKIQWMTKGNADIKEALAFLTIDNGKTWQMIFRQIENIKEYKWTVPTYNRVVRKAKLRLYVTDLLGDLYSAESVDFKIDHFGVHGDIVTPSDIFVPET